jgi:Restriction endonuclease
MVRSDSMPTRAIVVGDRVRVPWGLDVLEGEVTNVYDIGSGQRVVVRVTVPDVSEESETLTIALPVEVVEPVESDAEDRSPGEWVASRPHERRYEQSLEEALRRVLSSLPAPTNVERHDPDTGVDYLIRRGDCFVLIEAKAARQRAMVHGDAVRQLRRSLDRFKRLRGGVHGQCAAGLLVTDQELTEAAEQLLRDAPLRAVRWRGSRDDKRLAEALESLLSGAGQS